MSEDHKYWAVETDDEQTCSEWIQAFFGSTSGRTVWRLMGSLKQRPRWFVSLHMNMDDAPTNAGVFLKLEIVWWRTCWWKTSAGSWSCAGPPLCWHGNGQWRWALLPGGGLSGSLCCACRAQDWCWSARRTRATPERWRGKTNTAVNNWRDSISCCFKSHCYW